MRTRLRVSSAPTVRASDSASIADKMDRATFGPMPVTLSNSSKTFWSSRFKKAEQGDFFGPHMEMDMQKDGLAQFGQGAVDGGRDGDPVADAADVEDNGGRFGMGQQAAQGGDHSCASRRRRDLMPQGRRPMRVHRGVVYGAVLVRVIMAAVLPVGPGLSGELAEPLCTGGRYENARAASSSSGTYN